MISRLPAFFTASGTALLSGLPTARRLEILQQTHLERLTPHTENEPERLLRRVEQAARDGYSIISNETVMGDISVAAPITNHEGTAVAAINISVPTTRWTIETAKATLIQ